MAINYREDAKEADELIAELTKKGHRAKAFRADVSKPEQCENLVDLCGASGAHESRLLLSSAPRIAVLEPVYMHVTPAEIHLIPAKIH